VRELPLRLTCVVIIGAKLLSSIPLPVAPADTTTPAISVRAARVAKPGIAPWHEQAVDYRASPSWVLPPTT
jgi:hypothetical protein